MAISLSPGDAYAQAAAPTADEPDAVTLKHGGQIRGKLVEMLAGDHATVAMANGQNAIIVWDEIGSISRGGVPIKLPEAAPPIVVAPPPAPAAQPRPEPQWLGPARMPYDSDEPIPPGYHVEKHARLGLLISGAILSGIGLLGIVAFDAQRDVSGDDRVAFDLVWGTLFFGPGLPLFIVGIASPRSELVRDDVSLLKPLFKAFGAQGKAPPVFVGVDAHAQHKGISLGFHF